MLKWGFLVSILFCISCEKIENFKRGIDYSSFSWSGGTLFSEPSIVTTKEIHFDLERYLNNEIIIKGKVEVLGKFDTHLVISDSSGKMLIVLTHIEHAKELLSEQLAQNIGILGSVQRGKKGLPFVLAKSIKLDVSINEVDL